MSYKWRVPLVCMRFLIAFFLHSVCGLRTLFLGRFARRPLASFASSPATGIGLH